MQQTATPVSKTKVVLMWSILVGNLVFWLFFWAWRHRENPTEPADPESSARLFLLFVIGGAFLAAAVAAYCIVIATNCLTFSVATPFLPAYKGKLYLAKIVIPILLSVGLALLLSALLMPLFRALGVTGQMTIMLPLFAAIIPTQLAQMWINIWAPVTKKLIINRLAARGISPSQLETAQLVGISNPARSSFKKLTLVEDDMGALWTGGDRLIYWGDNDHLEVQPAQLLKLERRADAGSTSMLSGTAHVILHIQEAAGTVRLVRLHTEGHWTQGRNRSAMDALAAAIVRWHETPRPAAIAPPPLPAT